MLELILDCFAKKQYAVIEAGTGTGKSLAYLLPALHWSKQTGQKVVIATHTINLQEQLWNQDIPTMERLFDSRITAALVKGKANYLCLRKWEQRTREKKWTDAGELHFYLRTLVWLTETKTGDKSEININREEHELWPDVCGDPETCLGTGCRWFARDCFVMNAKRQAENADLLVANHSLVFADLKTDNQVLPEYKYIVFDEAHHLEDSATEYLGSRFSCADLKKVTFNLFREGKEGKPSLISRLKKFLSQVLERFPELFEKANQILDGIVTSRAEIDFALNDLKEQVGSYVINSGQEAEVESFVKTVRIRPEHLSLPQWQSIKVAGDNLNQRLDSLAKLFERLLKVFFTQDVLDEYNEGETLQKEAGYLYGLLIESINSLSFILALDNDNFVYWVEVVGINKEDIVFKAAPIKIKELLWQRFFNEKSSVILTSATLSVENSFDHYIGKVGLDLAIQGRVQTVNLEAPFEYDQQALLCVVNDLPNPTEVPEEEFAGEVAPVVAQIARILNGRTLCLFTSNKLLRETHSKLTNLLQNDGIAVLGQNIDGGRKALVEEFKKHGRSVLLGANSFWEGVDIPGELLSCVVIVKLPFSLPTIPTVEARVEQLQTENQDGFYRYSVPQAVIRLKQGFGRLIRKETDHGVVVILDKRIVQKRYGRVFLRSLPLKRHFKGDRHTVLQKISEWFDEGRGNTFTLNYINDFSAIEEFLKRSLNDQ